MERKTNTDNKKSVKSILKTSTSFDQKEKAQKKQQIAATSSKHAKWDEMNILATFHPPDKDYGHMKVEEPKTPYHWDDEVDAPGTSKSKQVDPEELTRKLAGVSGSPKRQATLSSSESDDDADEESRSKKKQFAEKRKLHYNEFQAVRLARKLMAEEKDVEEDEDDKEDGDSKG